jgi:hypothetical protein
LTNALGYIFRVAPVNRFGTGGFSGNSNVVTPTSTPSGTLYSFSRTSYPSTGFNDIVRLDVSNSSGSGASYTLDRVRNYGDPGVGIDFALKRTANVLVAGTSTSIAYASLTDPDTGDHNRYASQLGLVFNTASIPDGAAIQNVAFKTRVQNTRGEVATGAITLLLYSMDPATWPNGASAFFSATAITGKTLLASHTVSSLGSVVTFANNGGGTAFINAINKIGLTGLQIVAQQQVTVTSEATDFYYYTEVDLTQTTLEVVY